jgi:septum formation protein
MGPTLEFALASTSPRRRDLLQEAGFSFRVFPVKVSEIFDKNLNAVTQASHLATVKGEAAVCDHKDLKSQGYLVLSADTIVAVGETLLGKPKNSAEALQFLRLLSGRAHRVITGIYLQESGSSNFFTGYDETFVQFRQLSDQEMFDYVASGEPLDRAGAYAIQGGARGFVSSIKGSWSNVVGLPMELLELVLKEKCWNVRRAKS